MMEVNRSSNSEQIFLIIIIYTQIVLSSRYARFQSSGLGLQICLIYIRVVVESEHCNPGNPKLTDRDQSSPRTKTELWTKW